MKRTKQMTLKNKKIDDRLIRKGASHENPVPFDRSLGTPRETRGASDGLAIIDYKEVVQIRS